VEKKVRNRKSPILRSPTRAQISLRPVYRISRVLPARVPSVPLAEANINVDIIVQTVSEVRHHHPHLTLHRPPHPPDYERSCPVLEPGPSREWLKKKEKNDAAVDPGSS